jgi:hypothetical protein
MDYPDEIRKAIRLLKRHEFSGRLIHDMRRMLEKAKQDAEELSRLREAAEEALALITGDLVGGAIRVERKLRAALTSTQPETLEPERCEECGGKLPFHYSKQCRKSAEGEK